MRAVVQLAPGELFAERYRIERLLKAGGMGAVYVAQHVRTLDRVALKVMHPQIVSDADARARFEQEARVSSVIGSPAVVKVFDAGVDAASEMPFLVMELLKGKDLGEVVETRGRVEPRDVALYMSQVGRALDKAHAAGVVHRDLKPENLFLAEQDEDAPRIKILDFGIAKFLAKARATTTESTGTPLYMAPEQTKRSSEVGPHTDIWAFGLIAYTLLVGRPYWEAEDIHGLYAEILASTLTSARARASRAGVELPEAFDAWFARCVNRDAGARFPRAGEAAAALASALGAPTESELAKTEPAPPPAAALELAATEPVAIAGPRPRSRRGAIFGALVLALAAGGGLVAYRTRSAPIATQARPSGHPPTAMAAIPGGRFTMGDTKRDATVAPFYLDVTEVTVSSYKACVASGRCTAPNADDPRCNWENADRLRHPINCVDWPQAAAYCAAFGKRLPTEEEWEWAARGGPNARAYPWGAAAPGDQACWNGKGNTLGEGRRESTCAVGAFLTGTNAWEVHDLAGNVWEWTASAFEGTNKRVVRGGSWHTIEPDRLSAAYRFRREPEERDFLLGFRCAL